jgi:hypothetical protein
MSLELLNQLAEKAGLDDIPPYAIKFDDWGDRTSTTLVFNKTPDSSYLLNPIIAVPMRQHIGGPSKVPGEYKGVVAVHRFAVSHLALSSVKTPEKLKLILSPLINQGVIDLTNQIGSLHNMKLSLRMPGYSSFIREVDGGSAYEIRIVVIKE